MACCYIAASMIAFIVHTCEKLDLNVKIQYNGSAEIGYEEGFGHVDDNEQAFDGIADGVTIISISGMTCAACTATVEQALKCTEGVQQAFVSLTLQEARVFHDVDMNGSDLVTAINTVGYDATLKQRSSLEKIRMLQHTIELENLRRSLNGLSTVSAAVFGLGTGLEWLGLGRYLCSPLLELGRYAVLLTLVLTAIGKYSRWIFKDALKAASNGRVNMHTLISISAVVGLLLALSKMTEHGTPTTHMTYFDSSVGALLIVTVGRYMDLLSRRRATDTFTGLYSLLSQTAVAKFADLDGRRVNTSLLRTGDEIIIDPFTIVPCDCYVLHGTSHVNEALITGESLPKMKYEGDLLIAGCRNGPNTLRVILTQDGDDTFLMQLVKSVEVSLSTKASAQHRVDSITQYFVSVILSIAIAIGAWEFVAAQDGISAAYEVAGRRIMTVLAAACPCALGLATPCAVMAGIDVAWRKGILMLEGAETMERLKEITHVVMDKTGTLTRGSLTMKELKTGSKWRHAQQELAVLICAAEEHNISAHPLAQAVFRELLPMTGGLWQKYKASGGVRNVVNNIGRGINCEVNIDGVNWTRVLVGNLELIQEGADVEVDPLCQSIRNESGTNVFVVVDGYVAATMALQDTARPDAKATIHALKLRGLQITMLTGDNTSEATRIAEELEITVMASHASPSKKLEHIVKLQNEGHRVLMVGDGMNDGPALAAADAGVMVAHGNKCFSAGGSVLLLQSQIHSLTAMLDISKHTLWQINANILWALSYNVMAVGLGAGLGAPFGLSISPTVATAMMSISSVFITAQGIMLQKRLSRRFLNDDKSLWWS